jgi:hypothetical protein
MYVNNGLLSRMNKLVGINFSRIDFSFCSLSTLLFGIRIAGDSLLKIRLNLEDSLQLPLGSAINLVH